METTEFNRSGVALMGWNYNGQDLNTVYFNGNIVFTRSTTFEELWSVSFNDRDDVTSAYAVGITANNSPIVFTNISGNTLTGNIKVNAMEEWRNNTYIAVETNFSWSSSGTSVNVNNNSTYSFTGISHTSVEGEFYYDGNQHGKDPYIGTLNGATAYRVQFVYTDGTTGKEYYSEWYEFGSHYYYNPITNISQWMRGDLDLVFTAYIPNEPIGGYTLGDRVTGTLTICNTNPFPASIDLIAPEGVTLTRAFFDNISAGDTVQTTFTYTITQADILNGSKSFEFGAGIPGTGSSMNPITKNGQIWACTAETEEAYGNVSIAFNYSDPSNGEAYVEGEEVQYEVYLSNEGNISVENIVISCELSGDEWALAELGPHQISPVYEGSYEITPEDVSVGSVICTVEAHGTAINDEPVGEGIDAEWITMEVEQYTVTLNYYKQNLDGTYPSTPFNTESYTYDYNDYYNIYVSPVTGYTPDLARVVGTITQDITYDIYYSMNDWELIIYYTYQNGAEAATTYRHTYKWFESYSVASPTITGYTPSIQTISGSQPRGATTVIYTAVAPPNPGEIIDL